MSHKRLYAYVLLLLVSIIWGAASPVVKYTLTWFTPWLFLTYRFFVSTVIAIPYLMTPGVRLPKKSRDISLVLITGFISAPLSLFLFFEALDKTTALSGSLITAAAPLFLIMGGMIFFHDRVTRNEKTGVIIAIAGTILTVIGPLIMNGHYDTLGKLEGNTLMLFAVITDVIASLLSHECVKRGISATIAAQVQFILGFAIFLPVLFIKQNPSAVFTILTTAPWQAHVGVLFMAIVSGTLGYTMRNIAIKTIEVSESAPFSYLQPLWAAILAVVWLGEKVTVTYIAGACIIAIGVVIAETRLRARRSYALRAVRKPQIRRKMRRK